MSRDSELAVATKVAAGAPDAEIEITPEMIEAGMDAYRPFWGEIRDLDPGAGERMVMEVFRAMVSAASQGRVSLIHR